MERSHGMEGESGGMGYHPEAIEKRKSAQKEVLWQTKQNKNYKIREEWKKKMNSK